MCESSLCVKASFEVYAQAPLRLISWCSFELTLHAKRLLRQLAVMCEDPNTSTESLVAEIAKQQQEVQDEQGATRYLANLQRRPAHAKPDFN